MPNQANETLFPILGNLGKIAHASDSLSPPKGKDITCLNSKGRKGACKHELGLQGLVWVTLFLEFPTLGA